MNWDILLHTLEGVSYAMTPILVVVAVIGLRQLNISKRTFELTAKREQIKATHEQLKYFSDEVIPLVDELYAFEKEKKITIFKKSSFTLTDESAEIRVRSNGKTKEEFNLVGPHVVKIMNRLESVSTAFTSGLADEKTAFDVIGRAYCNASKKLFPLALAAGSDYYQNNLALYKLWNNRIETEQLEAKRTAIEEELSSHKEITKILPIEEQAS